MHELVKVLTASPKSAPLESDEQGVVDVASALKLYIRQRESLIPDRARQQWLHAAGEPDLFTVVVTTGCKSANPFSVISDEQNRFSAYRRLIQQLPDDSRATLNALFGHFYM